MRMRKSDREQSRIIKISEVYGIRFMNIKQVLERKKEHIDLLLLADEQENMVDKYLARGEMFR